MFKFKMSLLVQNVKFRVAVVILTIATIIAGIVYIPRNKAREVKSNASAQLTSNQIITEACKLIGKGYNANGYGGGHGAGFNVWDTKQKYDGVKYKLLDTSKFTELDCTGLIYYTLTKLGVSTSGFVFQNPVPVDPNHWYLVNSTTKVTKATNGLTFTYQGNQNNIKVLKANEKVSVRPYYLTENGTEIPSGTIVVANGASLGGNYHDHAWIYIGNLNTSDVKEVAKILVNEYGVNASLLVDGDINGQFTIKKFKNNSGNTVDVIQSTTANSTHWRIECTADKTGHGVYINNGDPRVDYENQGGNKVVGPIYAYQLASVPVVSGNYTVELVKVKEDGTTVITSDEATFEINGQNQNTAKGVLNIVKDKTIVNVNQKDTYTIKEVKAPEGYNAFEGTVSLNVGFKKSGTTYVIDGSKTNFLTPNLNGIQFKISDDSKKITVYVPNTEIPEEPDGKYSIELVKVKEDGTTVITSDEATFDINGKSTSTKSGKLTVISGKEIENENQKDTYTISETKAPKGFDKFVGDLSLDVQFKLNEKTNKYIIDADKTTSKGFKDQTRFEISADGTKITVYVVNNEKPEIHKGVGTVENQDSGYYYFDLKENKKYSEEELTKVLHKWVVETSIESGIEKYNKYVVTDKVDTSKLVFSGLDNVKVTLIDLEGKETSLKLGEDYKVAYENDTLMVTFIDKDFKGNVIKNAKAGSLTGYKLRVVFNTTFKVEDGKLVVLKDSVKNAENQAELTYDNGSGKEVKEKSEIPEVHTGAVSVFKYDEATGKALVGAEFKIAESKEDAAANKFVKDAEGKDLVAISNEQGVATFTGLEFGGDAKTNGTKQANETYTYDWEKASKDYYVVETKAPAGYLLMTEAVKVTVSKNSTENIDLTDKMVAIANKEVKGTYNFTITKKDAETTEIIEDETTVFDIKVYSDVNEDGTFSEDSLVELKDINDNTINTTNIHAKTNGITEIINIKITDSEKKAGTYYFVIEETQAPDEYTEIDYRVVVPIKFVLENNEYVAKHDTGNSYALVKDNGKETKKSLKEMATNENECASSEQLDLVINVNVPNKHKDFDLSLRKYITAINGVEPGKSREPQVDVSELASGKATTAKYNHPKNALDVNTLDIVTYTLRVYNEGGVSGYATQVMDYIPEGLEFVPGTEVNNKYKWVLYKEASKDDKNALEFDGKKYVKTENAKEADIIVTEYLSKANGENNLIKAFDGKTLDFKDIKVDFKVVEPQTSDRIIENHAQITKHTDKNGNPVIDRDSTPNKWINNEDDQDIEKIKVRYFDLSLRKFITAVNGIAPEESREPQVDVSELASGKATTATYKHTKNPVDVNTTDIVTYTIRVYNEGGVDGYATQVMDDIPEGLEFVPGTEVNNKYKWVLYKEVSDDNKDAIEFDGKKYVKTEDAKEADVIVTEYLSKENSGDNLIKAFDGKNISYKDVKVDFKVVEPQTSDRIVTNYAQVTKHTDRNGNTVLDIDSTPNKWIENEDDQDIENVRVRYFDLSLLKYVTKAIVYENGTKNVIETGHTGYENPEPVVKVDLQQANLKNVTVKFEYTIKITNDGEKGSAVAGYAKEISDYIPEGLKFVPEDNKNWKEVDGKIVTDALADTLLQPGESAEVTVILTWINGENNLGLKTNTAEISKDYNEYGTPDRDSTPNNKVPGEDDIDDAQVMLAIRTGMPKQYYGIIAGVLALITAGVIVIKKKVIA